MTRDPLTRISTRRTPQTRPADARRARNAAGGYTFTVGTDARIHRFLTIGTTGGTYYTTERALTRETADVVLAAARADASALVRQVVAVSTAGRAPRQNPAILALAAASALGDDAGRRAALEALPLVCRTGTHLFQWAGYRQQFGGWGRGTRRAVARWYTDRPVDALAYQVLKYRQREGWTHRDLLRQAHPVTREAGRRALFRWITGGGSVDDVPPLVAAFVEAQASRDVATWLRLIDRHQLSWEMLPDAALTEPAVWERLIAKGLPQTALVRQLARLTRLGLLTRRSDVTRLVAGQLADPERLRRARVHPVNLLVALRTYAAGRSARGESSWAPVRQVVDALDAAFYAAFGAIEPAGRRTLVAVDVSGSMTWPAAGLSVTAAEVAAAMALVTVATEPEADVVAFSHQLTPLAISPRQRLDDVLRLTRELPFGATDCSLPMQWALQHRLDVDTFLVVTDNETWAGRTHPHQALATYRERTGIPARLAVLGVTATECSIADPDDPGMLDVAGFDAAAPGLVADFSRGDL